MVWIEKHTITIVNWNAKVFQNYMMVNVPILNHKDVNIVKDFSMQFVVSMELLMITYVTYNVPKLIYSVKELALQSERIVNAIRDMSLFVVLIIKLIETIVWWNVLKLENNTMVFAEITKLITLKYSENANVEINNKLFVELMEELIWTLVIWIV